MTETSDPAEELWHGWTAGELWRAGLLYLGKGLSVLIIGVIIFLYPSEYSLGISIVFFVFGGVEVWLGQWFYRQSRVMTRN